MALFFIVRFANRKKSIMNLFTKLTFLLVSSLIIISCGDKKNTDAGNTNDTTVKDTANAHGHDHSDPNHTHETEGSEAFKKDRESVKAEINEELNQLEAKINKLDEKIEKQSGEAREKSRERKKELQAEHARLKEKLNEVDKTSESNWDNFKSEFKKDMKNFGESVENFFEKDK